jgi:hypothetical protein
MPSARSFTARFREFGHIGVRLSLKAVQRLCQSCLGYGRIRRRFDALFLIGTESLRPLPYEQGIVGQANKQETPKLVRESYGRQSNRSHKLTRERTGVFGKAKP